MAEKKILSADYRKFYREIKSRVMSARVKVSKSVNREAIALYWDIMEKYNRKTEKT
jgi:hypothetical protein